jgi:hypothetical protein
MVGEGRVYLEGEGLMSDDWILAAVAPMPGVSTHLESLCPSVEP